MSDVSSYIYIGEFLREIESWKLFFMRSNFKITSIYSIKLILNNCWLRKNKVVNKVWLIFKGRLIVLI